MSLQFRVVVQKNRVPNPTHRTQGKVVAEDLVRSREEVLQRRIGRRPFEVELHDELHGSSSDPIPHWLFRVRLHGRRRYSFHVYENGNSRFFDNGGKRWKDAPTLTQAQNDLALAANFDQL